MPSTRACHARRRFFLRTTPFYSKAAAKNRTRDTAAGPRKPPGLEPGAGYGEGKTAHPSPPVFVLKSNLLENFQPLCSPTSHPRHPPLVCALGTDARVPSRLKGSPCSAHHSLRPPRHVEAGLEAIRRALLWARVAHDALNIVADAPVAHGRNQVGLKVGEARQRAVPSHIARVAPVPRARLSTANARLALPWVNRIRDKAVCKEGHARHVVVR